MISVSRYDATMEPTSKKKYSKPKVIKWRLSSYSRTKKGVSFSHDAKGSCPNASASNDDTPKEKCYLCGQLHPLLRGASEPQNDVAQCLVSLITGANDPFRSRRPEDDDPFCQRIIHECKCLSAAPLHRTQTLCLAPTSYEILS